MKQGAPSFYQILNAQNKPSVSHWVYHPKLEVKKLVPEAVLPSRATEGSVGYDLCSIEDDVIMPNGGKACIATGIAVGIPAGYYGRIAPRSGLAVKFGIDVGAGVIDPDYTGEVRVVLFNHGKEELYVQKGYRIAQLILEKVLTPEVVEVNELSQTERGDGGFGSSGVK